MSHFVVMVVGDDVEAQLQPYHEFECTGHNDEFVQDVDITDQVREHMANYDDSEEPMPDPLGEALEYWGLEDKIVRSEDEVDREHTHKYGYVIVENNQLIRAVNRTNPNKKWDWYVIGGRWDGFFKLKPGASGTPNQALKGEIDWDRMKAEREQSAANCWDKVREISPELWLSWEEVRNRVSDIDEARQFYHHQPGRKRLWEVRDLEELRWAGDEVLVSREEYLQQARADAVTTFALLHNHKWYERGEMGWWGAVGNPTDKKEWSEKFAQMLDDLPDDTLITVVDCHI